ncbi:hypothetical protein GCM10023231_00210 [Olivibacter ginsenosidimutans]|uniref:histidine kinase n=1 Tax=Olivibacter ginsenosidimutans TaxID=1176537 RepID=A0ABP9AAM3_9SPHI
MNDNAVVLIAIIFIGLTIALCGFFFLFHKSQQKIARQQKKLQEEKLLHHQALIKASVRSQDQERQRIGRDLHDSMGSAITMLHLRMSYFEEQHPHRSPELTSFFNDFRSQLDQLLQSCRQISHQLSPEIHRLYSPSESLEELCQKAAAQHQVDLSMTDGARQVLDEFQEEQAINLYRILEELLHNTLRHAHANRIHIQLMHEADQLWITYQDNGKGIDPENTIAGHGMQHIESRLLVLGGQKETTPFTDGGYRLQFSIPVDQPISADQQLTITQTKSYAASY